MPLQSCLTTLSNILDEAAEEGLSYSMMPITISYNLLSAGATVVRWSSTLRDNWVNDEDLLRANCLVRK
jgi:hypothetical protein